MDNDVESPGIAPVEEAQKKSDLARGVPQLRLAPDRARRTSRGTVLGLFGSSLVAQGLALLVAPITARVLGPALRGEAALVTVYDDASTAVFNLGIPLAVGYLGKEGQYSEEALFSGAIRGGVVALLLSVPTGLAIVEWPLSSADVATKILSFVLIGFSPVIALVSVTSRQFLVNKGDLAGLRTTNLIAALLRVLVVLITWLTGTLDLATTVIAFCYSSYLSTLYCVLRARVRPSRNSAPLATLFAYGLRALPMSLSNLANGRIDQLIIAPFLGAHALGIYAIGVTVNSVPIQFGNAVASDVFHRIPADSTQRHLASDAVRRSLLAMTAICVALGLVVGVGVVGLVFGQAYSASRTVSLLLLPGTFAFGSVGVLSIVATALGRPSLGSAGIVTSLFSLLLCVPAGILIAGLDGAACGSSAAYLIGFCVNAWLLRRENVRPILPRATDCRLLVEAIRSSCRRLLAR